jgi:hypothetical protein
VTELHVYDPALCCSTGVCGPEVDAALVHFAADLEWLRTRGVVVRRYNLAQEPNAFAASALVRSSLQQNGTRCLPLLILGETILSRGRYPSREELAAWAGVDTAPARSRPPPTAAPETAVAPSCCGPRMVGLGGQRAPGARSSCC